MSKTEPVAEMKLTLAELHDNNLDQRLLNYKDCKFWVDVEFSDGHKIVHAKDLVVSYYLWEVLRVAGVPPQIGRAHV